MADMDPSAAEAVSRKEGPPSAMASVITEPLQSPTEVSTGDTFSVPADSRLTAYSDEANPSTTVDAAVEPKCIITDVTPSATCPEVDVNVTKSEAPVSDARASVSLEAFTSEEAPSVEVPTAPQQAGQEQRRGLNFGLDAWKKASGTASSLLSTARESRLKNAMALGKATLTDFISSLDTNDPLGSEPQSSQEDVHQTPEKPRVESRKAASSQSPPPGLSEDEIRRLEAFERLHQQIEQLESERERLRQVEVRTKREVEDWKRLAEERQTFIDQFESELGRQVSQTEKSVRAELQQEFVKAMTDNEKRISDLKIIIKQREKRLEELEIECERRANALEEALEAQARMASELEAQGQLERRLHEELEAGAQKYQGEVDRWKTKYEETLAELEVARTINQEVGEKRQQGDHVSAALEAENRQLQAQLSAMKTRWSALSIFEGNMAKVAREMLSDSELAALEECKTPNDVLTLFKKSQLLLTQLERRLSVSAQTVESLQSEITGLRQAHESSQNELASLRERMLSNVSRNGMAEPVGTSRPAVEVDTSVTAMLEARLAAKTERVEALVCEVAQLRAQLSSQQSDPRKAAGPSFVSDHFTFMDDGRDSLFWLFILVPIIRLIGKVKGPNVAHRVENKFRKMNNRLTRHPSVLFIDQKLRLAVNTIARSRSTRFASLIYFVAIHLVLFLSLLVADSGVKSANVES